MNKMIIFDPAMCCSTGVCGPSVNPELLRVATVLNTLKNQGIIVERHNLTSNPQIFVTNKIINEILMTKGVQALPIIMVNGKIVKMGGYPSNKEFCKLLDIPEDYLKANIKRPTKCNCKDGHC
ncbi:MULTISPECIES: arsenite efflux transporter metallochaperone ArsD [Clostridium]|uniref:arsenite efflux transporter metallochaperone ArsD n=1 Tax=Clostridium TaxID=1485 RepID=UPI00077352E3|nr:MULTISPECIES: arsenite efflux transporter metallochaperone ArsD [Clostridium]NFI56036.1 arsenite efflux transporter metallochaperone ArsD [Clostridium botulinum]NFL86251.1 arsenite efflux transporter metallochaperone ArsD [Clostridium botulinum]NFO21125.1 arsenite efflux transporter metallochaperone ArsD [Clostridium botulinum]NFO33164.1 arsenite efflux transporter metallochaperone ArsD [Clostridium botulinum]NFR86784.1 arsenite efflux transporter metallochaperone ArsD [Clostridium botulinu